MIIDTLFFFLWSNTLFTFIAEFGRMAVSILAYVTICGEILYRIIFRSRTHPVLTEDNVNHPIGNSDTVAVVVEMQGRKTSHLHIVLIKHESKSF